MPTSQNNSTDTGLDHLNLSPKERLERKLRLINIDLAKNTQTFAIAAGGKFGDGGVYDRGAQFLLSGEQVIYPLCFHNSYWSKGQTARDTRAIREICAMNIHYLISNGPAEHNYRALFGEDFKNLSKDFVRRQLQNLNARAEEAKKVFDTKDGGKFSSSDIGFWEDVKSNPVWIKEANNFRNLYNTNASFKSDVDLLTTKSLVSHALIGRIGGRIISPTDVAVAVNYAIDELTFVAASPELLGVNKINFLYHKDWVPFVKWANGEYDGIRKENFGFLAIHGFQSHYDPQRPVLLSMKDMEQLTSTKQDWSSHQYQIVQRGAAKPDPELFEQLVTRMKEMEMEIADLRSAVTKVKLDEKFSTPQAPNDIIPVRQGCTCGAK